MSFSDNVKTIFQADSTLLTYVQSVNIFTYNDTKRTGISLKDTPTTYSSTGILQPCIVIKDRSQTPDDKIVSSYNQTRSTRHTLEVWFYNSGDIGYDVIENMRKRVYVLLAEQKINNSLCRLINNILSQRDPAMAQAAWERSDYVIYTFEP